jgi:hypothetical protein
LPNSTITCPSCGATVEGGFGQRCAKCGAALGLNWQPCLGFIPKDEETVVKAVPRGTVIAIYYNSKLKGDYRVRFRGGGPPGVASHDAMAVVAKYGAGALAVTGLVLLGFLRLRRFSQGSA